MGSGKNSADSFCVLPYTNLSVGPDGFARVCCNNTVTYSVDPKLDLQNPPSESIKDHPLNSDLHKEIRRDILSNKRHSSCRRCWEVEDGGGESYRKIFNALYEERLRTPALPYCKDDGEIEKASYYYVDITLGNNCNLRCRMCNPYSSHQWIKEAKEFNFWNKSEQEIKKLEDLNWFKNPVAFDFLIKNLRHVDRLNFLGGEPLLIDEHISILEKCIDQNLASEMSIQYNSNLTYLPKKIRALWSNFKYVEINSSCDGYGALNEYIRFPMKWSRWLENVVEVAGWRENINLSLSFHSTFQTLNVTQLSDLYAWCWELGTKHNLPRLPFMIYVTQPGYYDPRHMPNELKALVVESHQKYFAFLSDKTLSHSESAWLSMLKSHLQTMTSNNESSSDFSNDQWKKFIDVTNKIDRSRGQNVLSVLPEFKKYF